MFGTRCEGCTRRVGGLFGVKNEGTKDTPLCPDCVPSATERLREKGDLAGLIRLLLLAQTETEARTVREATATLCNDAEKLQSALLNMELGAAAAEGTLGKTQLVDLLTGLWVPVYRAYIAARTQPGQGARGIVFLKSPGVQLVSMRDAKGRAEKAHEALLAAKLGIAVAAHERAVELTKLGQGTIQPGDTGARDTALFASLTQAQLNILAQTSPHILMIAKSDVPVVVHGMPAEEEKLLKSLSPKQIEALYGLQKTVQEGVRDAEAGRYHEALSCFEKCLATAPWHFIAAKSAGACHSCLGDHKRAKEMMQLAYKLAPNDKSVLDNLAALDSGS